MIEIGARPILWHIMKLYAARGVNDFIICCGYRGYVIKEYFANYFLHSSDVTFDLEHNRMQVHSRRSEPWRVTLVDTGGQTLTGGRLRRVREHVGDETFCMTYGDGVSNADVSAVIEFHRAARTLATLTAVRPPGRFGALTFAGDGAGELDVESSVLLFRSRGDTRAPELVCALRQDRLRQVGDRLLLAERVVLVEEAVLRTQNLAIFL